MCLSCLYVHLYNIHYHGYPSTAMFDTKIIQYYVVYFIQFCTPPLSRENGNRNHGNVTPARTCGKRVFFLFGEVYKILFWLNNIAQNKVGT